MWAVAGGHREREGSTATTDSETSGTECSGVTCSAKYGVTQRATEMIVKSANVHGFIWYEKGQKAQRDYR